MPRILIIYHTLSGNTEDAAHCVVEGAKEDGQTRVVLKNAREAEAADLLDCDGIAVGTPDYFHYMAGMVKDFFDRTFYATRDEVNGKPCLAFITHGGGGKARDSVIRICETFGFDLIAEPVMVQGRPNEAEKEALRNAGRMLAARSR